MIIPLDWKLKIIPPLCSSPSILINNSFLELQQMVYDPLMEALELETVKVALRSAVALCKGAISEADEALKWNDSSKVMPMMRPIYTWFNENYTSTNGYSLRIRLHSLAKTNKKYEQVIKQILDVPELPRDSNDRVGIESRFFTLVQVLSELTNRFFNDAQLASSAVGVITSLREKLRKLRSIRHDDIGVDTRRIDSEPKKPNIVSQQNSQVETLVNQVLSGLSPKDAGEIRQAIAKTDNKIAALQRELQRRNIVA